MAYTDHHRTFLLNIFQQSFIKESDALKMYREIFEDGKILCILPLLFALLMRAILSTDNATIKNMTETTELINEKLRPLNQQINKFNSEQLNSKYLVFVNTDASDLML